MIKVDDNCTLEIKGDKTQVLYQLRALIEAFSESKEFKVIFDDNLDFFNPLTSRKEVRDIIFKEEEESKKNDKSRA